VKTIYKNEKFAKMTSKATKISSHAGIHAPEQVGRRTKWSRGTRGTECTRNRQKLSFSTVRTRTRYFRKSGNAPGKQFSKIPKISDQHGPSYVLIFDPGIKSDKSENLRAKVVHQKRFIQNSCSNSLVKVEYGV